MKKLLLLAAGLLVSTAANAVDVTVNESSGALAGTSTYSTTYTGSAAIDVIINSTKSNGGAAANMKWSNSNLQIYSGDPAPATYTLTCNDENYYVSSYSFTAQATSGSQSIAIQGGDAVALSTTEGKTFSSGHISKGTTASFVLSGNNVGTVLTDFTVTLTHRVRPEEEGWYIINGNVQGTHYYIENANAEFRQNASNAYSLKLVNAYSETQPAVRFIKINPVSDTKIVVSSSNGHYLNNNCTSNRNSAQTNFTVQEVADFAAQIGGYWSTYTNTGSESPYVGQTGGHSSNRFIIEKAYPEEVYDIWTVTLTGTTNAAEIQNDVQLTLNHVENKGLNSVYNNGTFFVTKGTKLRATDFSAPEHAGNASPLIAVDNDAHTVTVDYTQDAGERAEAEQALEDYKQEHFSDLLTIGTLTSAELTAILRDVVIADNATDFEAALATAKTEVDNFDILPGVISTLNGRKVTMRCIISGDNGNKDAIAGAESGNLKHYNDLRLESVWVMDFAEEGNTMTIRNLVYGNYIGGKSGNNAQMSADPVTYTFALADGSLSAFTFQNTAVDGNNYLNMAAGNNVYFHAGASSNQGSHWTITPVDATVEQPFVDALATKYPAGVTTGTNPGNVDADPEAYAAAKAQAAAQVAGNLDYPVAKSLMTAEWPAVLGVETGRLIRIKNSTGAHYFSMNDSNNAFNTADTESSIFYYSPSQRLVNVKYGVGAVREGNTSGNGHKLFSRTTAEQNVDFEANTHAFTIENGTTPATTHQCAIYWDFAVNGANGLAFLAYVGSDANNRCIGWGSKDTHANLVAAQGANYLTIWSFLIEYVNALPVAIGADECGSIVAPVALQIPVTDKFKFYECVTEGNLLKFRELTAETIVPAETPVLVWRTAEGTAQSVDIPVCYDAPAEAAALADEATAANRFAGSYLTLPNADADDAEMITYVKASDITPGSDEATEAVNSNDTSVAFKRAEGTVPAGAVTVQILKDTEDIPDAVMLSLNGENVGTTAITTVEAAAESAVEAIYDLQGRRLAAPVKGINIINGKKVLVK